MQSIPETSRPFFQEYNFEHLDPERNAELIIERLLAYGDRDEVRWLLKQYGREQVKRWLSETGNRLLPQRRYHLWCFLFDVAETLRDPVPVWPY